MFPHYLLMADVDYDQISELNLLSKPTLKRVKTQSLVTDIRQIIV